MVAIFLFNVILKTVNQFDLHHATTSLKTTEPFSGHEIMRLFEPSQIPPVTYSH